MKKRFFVLGLVLFVLGFFLLFIPNINITGAVVGISSVTTSSLGILSLILLGFLCMIEGTLEEKIRKDPLKHLRRYVNKYHRDFLGLVSYVVDTLARAKPVKGFKGSNSLKKEKRKLKSLAEAIANKYDLSTNEVYSMISEDLHKEKPKYGRKGR